MTKTPKTDSYRREWGKLEQVLGVPVDSELKQRADRLKARVNFNEAARKALYRLVQDLEDDEKG